jgi:hypothetical protein
MMNYPRPPVVRARPAPPQRQRDSRRGPHRSLIAALVASHVLELIALFGAAGATARLARAHPGHGAGLPSPVTLAALVLVGWQAGRLLRGRRTLNASGLAVQSGILMASIAVTVQNLAAGLIGVALASAVLAGWGRLGTTKPVDTPVPPKGVQVEPPRRASQLGVRGVLLAVLTAVVILAALSVRSGIIFGLAVPAVIFIPIERLFALHPRRVLRQGWRTDVVHYLVNGAALRIGLLVSVVVVGGVLRAFVPLRCAMPSRAARTG